MTIEEMKNIDIRTVDVWSYKRLLQIADGGQDHSRWSSGTQMDGGECCGRYGSGRKYQGYES